MMFLPILFISYRAGGNGSAVLVLAEPVFLKVIMNFHLYKNQVINKSEAINKSASVIFRLVRLIILSYSR